MAADVISLLHDRCPSLHAPFALRPAVDSDPVETKEWVDAFRGVLATGGSTALAS